MPGNISPIEKLRAINEVLSGKHSVATTASAYGIHPESLRQMVK